MQEIKSSFLALVCFTFTLTLSTKVRADFTDNFSSTTPVGWQVNPTAPASWGINSGGGSGTTGYMEISIANVEFNNTEPEEGITRAVDPNYTDPGTTWTVSGTLNGASTSQSVPASKEISATTGSGTDFFQFGLLAGASNHSLGYTPLTGYQFVIWNQPFQSWTYLSAAGLIYSGGNTLTMSYAGNGVVDYYLSNPIVGTDLIYSQTGVDVVGGNVNDLTDVGLTSYNFDAGGNNSFWSNASAITVAPVPEPAPISYLGLGFAAILSFRKLIHFRSSTHASC